jgi:hypothetical protein
MYRVKVFSLYQQPMTVFEHRWKIVADIYAFIYQCGNPNIVTQVVFRDGQGD